MASSRLSFQLHKEDVVLSPLPALQHNNSLLQVKCCWPSGSGGGCCSHPAAFPQSPRAAAVGVWISEGCFGWRDTTCSAPKVWQDLTCLQNKPSLFLYPCSKRVSMKPCSEKKYEAQEPRKPFGDCSTSGHAPVCFPSPSWKHWSCTTQELGSPHPWGAQVSQDILSTAQRQPSTLCVQHSSITLNKLCPSCAPQLLPPSPATLQIMPATIWKCLGWNVVSFLQ